MRKLLFTALTIIVVLTQIYAQQATYDVTPGYGNGLRFWSSNSYKIHMGNSSEYHYGPVTEYSIKMNMNSTTGRGWTWGQSGLSPVAAINNLGVMQIAGSFTSKSNGIFDGSLAIGKSDPGNYKLYVNGNTYANGSLTFPTVAYNGTTSFTHLSFPVNSDGFYISTQQLSRDKMEVLFRLRDNTTGDSFRMWFDDYRGENYDRNPFIVYGDRVLLASDGGNVGIGTTSPDYKLDVLGTIRAKEVKVATGWSDFVFKPDYKLKSLDQVQDFINDNGHLPDIPSAEEVKENGISLGEMDAKLLQKIEELTLYMIRFQKQVALLKAENTRLKSKMENIKTIK